MSQSPQYDLAILVADKDAEWTVRSLLERSTALGIRKPTYERILTHPSHDPGVFLGSHDMLRQFANRCRYALVLFDREGCGQEKLARADLELQVEQQLAKCGWGDRAAAVALDPELEIWVWSDSPHVDDVCGWKGHEPSLREWLLAHKWLSDGTVKPERPKEALKAALRQVNVAFSASLFGKLAERVSLKRCTDPALQKLLTVLQGWFPPDAT